MGRLIWAYLNRIGVYGSAVGAIALATGTLGQVQTFIEHHRAIGVILVLVDICLFAIDALAAKGVRDDIAARRIALEEKGRSGHDHPQ